MQLDDWVLCRIYKKKNVGRIIGHFDQPKVEAESFQMAAAAATDNQNPNQNENYENEQYKFPRTYSLTHLWELDYMGSISQLLNDNSSYNVGFNGEDDNNGDKKQLPFGQPSDSTKSHVHQTTFVNPVYDQFQ